MEKLERFLVSTRWEALFPLTTVHKLTREASDHNPIIIDTMETQEVKKNSFRFEKSWLSEIEFMSRVERSWAKPVRARNSIERFQNKLKM